MFFSEEKVAEKKDDAAGFSPALAAVQGEIAALGAHDLEAINVDVNAAVVTAMGCVAELETYRSQLAGLPSEDAVRSLDKLDLYARALGQAHAIYLRQDAGSVELTEASKRVVDARALLCSIATLLVNRKVLEENALGQLKGTVGFKNQSNDVLQLVDLLRGAIAKGTAGALVSSAELDEAERAVRALMLAMGRREQGPQMQSEAAELRQRCFTLLVRAYDELRRSIGYLRYYEEDDDTIIPSLYGGRTRKAKDAVEPTPIEPVVASPAVVSPPVAPVSPTTDAPSRPGLPNSDPFKA